MLEAVKTTNPNKRHIMPEPDADRTLSLLRRMFTGEGVGGYGPDDGAGVRCPFCPTWENASYIHTDTFALNGNDHYEASGSYGLAVRGSIDAIEFASETCKHRWALAFGFHKGATFVTVVRLPDHGCDWWDHEQTEGLGPVA